MRCICLSPGYSVPIRNSLIASTAYALWERQHPAGCRQDGGAPGCVSPVLYAQSYMSKNARAIEEKSAFMILPLAE